MTDTKRDDFMEIMNTLCRQLNKALAENAALDAQLDKAVANNAAERYRLHLDKDELGEVHDEKLQFERAVAAELSAKVTALESMQSRFKGLEADMRGTMTTLEAERNTVAHLRAQVQTKDDAITLLEEDNAALDARVGELLKAPIMPDHYPVGSKVYCRTTSGIRKSRIDDVRITVGESESQLHYTIDGGMWPVTQVFLTADEAFASTTH